MRKYNKDGTVRIDLRRVQNHWEWDVESVDGMAMTFRTSPKDGRGLFMWFGDGFWYPVIEDYSLPESEQEIFKKLFEFFG